MKTDTPATNQHFRRNLYKRKDQKVKDSKQGVSMEKQEEERARIINHTETIEVDKTDRKNVFKRYRKHEKQGSNGMSN